MAKSGRIKEVLRVQEVASLVEVSPSTVRVLARRGLLLGRKVGKEWQFVRSTVLAGMSGDSQTKQVRQV